MKPSFKHSHPMMNNWSVYLLLLSFVVLVIPLNTSHPQPASLHMISFAGSGHAYDVSAANPPPWNKSFPPPAARLFRSMQISLPNLIGSHTAWLGNSIPLLVKHERLDPIKYTSNYVDAVPF
ncbi:hypothetical protein FHS18_005339 [Paenibacillus phyllosphaerae]|uniref:Uncharacterized protein n=1 Tax=Paenibacillus phyllosphaerae TaxID=274593 RepID=A0A7W5B3H1_9BACL|nr:hypothetical protein [Paenibacillus phyllosphaerae]MBB3113236.1 hypothetical protein [Paenibacillus phyllosphaerae]